MPDWALARRMALERLPAKWLGCDLRMFFSPYLDAVVFYAPGMADDEGIEVGMRELLYAQIKPTPPTPSP